MSLNNDNAGQNPAWQNDAKNTDSAGAAAQSTLARTAGTVQGGLGGLLRLSSMTSDNRNLPECAAALKELQEYYDAQKKASINELQRKIIPQLLELTSTISPVLPGIGLHVEVGDTLYCMVALFSNAGVTINSERIEYSAQPGTYGNSSLSIPLTPVQYANVDVYNRVREHYQRIAESRNIKHVSVINMLLVDLEMLKHEEAGEAKDQARNNALFVASEWEEALLVKSVLEMTSQNLDLPNPFLNADAPYDKANCAEARVVAISGRTTKGKTLTADNMEVTATTVLNNGQNRDFNYTRDFNANSKEICRVQAIVSLNAVSWDEYSRFIMSHRTPDQMSQLQAFMGAASMGGSAYPNGFRPLRPVITMGDVQAGEMLGYNGGLYPYFYALYLLMCTNNHFVWAEALRKQAVGSRGSLADLEVRIKQMLAMVPGGLNIQREELDVKKLADTDFVSNWIRMNVSPHATFQVNILQAGPHASVHNFLWRLADQTKNSDEVKTVVKLIDAMSKKKMSAVIEKNVRAGTGWIPGKPILLPTGMISVNGRARMGDKTFNTQEADEMMISHVKGKNNMPAIEQFLHSQYGIDQREGFKQRCQKLRLEMTSAMQFNGDVHINGFAQPHIWAPDFMAALGEAMDGIGQLNVANNIGTYRSNQLVFAPGVGLATVAAAGSSNPNAPSLGTAYGQGVPFI